MFIFILHLYIFEMENRFEHYTNIHLLLLLLLFRFVVPANIR